MNTPAQLIEVLVPSSERGFLMFLHATGGADGGITWGQIREVADPGDLRFDIGPIIGTLQSLSAVLDGLSAAEKFVEIVLRATRSHRDLTIEIRVGRDRVVIESDGDPDRTRSMLEAALKLI